MANLRLALGFFLLAILFACGAIDLLPRIWQIGFAVLLVVAMVIHICYSLVSLRDRR